MFLFCFAYDFSVYLLNIYLIIMIFIKCKLYWTPTYKWRFDVFLNVTYRIYFYLIWFYNILINYIYLDISLFHVKLLVQTIYEYFI